MNKVPMQFPYGAVYFRKSNPPKEDWERDYAQAAKDGINIFRHWFMWGSIETAPGVFDWDDYDRQLDLAAKYGIKTIIAEISHSIPEWLAAKYPDLLEIDANGKPCYPKMGVSTATGGFNHGLCLDKAAARELNAIFLTRLAERYKDHQAMMGYDVQNECNFHEGGCYCADTITQYQAWLKNKYTDIQTLNEMWRKYSYTSFDEIRFPETLLFYPESADWLTFQHDNFHRNMQWKIDTIRKVDAKNLMSAHGIASTFRVREEAGTDDWTAANMAELYGFTWVPCRHGNEPWRLFSAADLTRAASRGKPFWHAEAQGGHLWLQPQLKGRPANDGRIADEKDLRIWNLISFACGSRGLLYPRYRPLLDGPLFGAFAPYEMDGSPTPRSEMAANIAKWLNAAPQKGLVESQPVKGQIGILYVPECSAASYLHAQFGNEDCFFRMMSGVYQGFFDNNIQADFVHIDDIDSYTALYFPYPVSMTSAQAEKLACWVKQGGTLVSEACPAYFGDNLRAGQVQPNLGLDEVFGARQKRVEFMPDILTDIHFELFDTEAGGEGYLQTYECKNGSPCAFYKDEVIAVSNNFGKGKTLLIGAFLSGSYARKGDKKTAECFKQIFAYTKQKPDFTLSNNVIRARMSGNDTENYLWLLNPTADDCQAKVSLRDNFKQGEILWQGGSILSIEENMIEVSVQSRDALIITLKR